MIQTPVNQVRLTNIAVVRYRKKGKRFELACYPNKVLSWRKGNEKDLDEVLQTTKIFTNVSKGILAKKKDLSSCFDEMNEESIMLEILSKGDVSSSEKERSLEINSKLKDIISIICDKSLNSETKRPFPSSVIETALHDIHYNVSNKTAKQQALELIKSLKEAIPIIRAHMRIKIKLPLANFKEGHSKSEIYALFSIVEDELYGNKEAEITALIEPGKFRELNSIIGRISHGNGSLEVQEVSVQNDFEAVESKIV